MKENLMIIISFLIVPSISYAGIAPFSLDQNSASSLSLDILNDEMIVVINEPHFFVEPFPFILNERNIDFTSIIIWDVTRTLIYNEGDDYIINVIGDQVEITATTLGVLPPNILDGQILSVDYLYYIPEPATLILLVLGAILVGRRRRTRA